MEKIIKKLEDGGFTVELKSHYLKVSGCGCVVIHHPNEAFERKISVRQNGSKEELALEAAYSLYSVLNPDYQAQSLPLLMVNGDKAVYCDRGSYVNAVIADLMHKTQAMGSAIIFQGDIQDLEDAIECLYQM